MNKAKTEAEGTRSGTLQQMARANGRYMSGKHGAAAPSKKEGPEVQLTGAEIIAQMKKKNLLGAWKDRTDITDSVEFAEELRRKAETRECD